MHTNGGSDVNQGLDLQLGIDYLTLSPIDIDCAAGDVATALPGISPGAAGTLQWSRDYPILAIDQHLTGVRDFKVMLRVKRIPDCPDDFLKSHSQ